MFSLLAVELERLEPLAAVVPYAMKTSRSFTVPEIHGAYVCRKSFADAKESCSNLWNGQDQKSRGRMRSDFSGRGSKNLAQRERKFITATKIGPSRDIAVMAQFQRNAGIGVALAAS